MANTQNRNRSIAGSFNWREEIRKEAKRIHESTECSSETQFEYAKRWRRVDRWLGALAALLAAVAGVGGLSQVVSTEWAGLIAIVSAGVGAVAASLGAPQTKEKASVSANAYRSLQQDTRIFLEIDLPTLNQEEARKILQQLVDRHQQLNSEADIPSQNVWERAKRSLASGSQSYKADK
jgi:hypothetical protein